MKQFLEDQELKNMTVPAVGLGHHQAQLRRVLVSRATQRADEKPLTLQGAITFMKNKTILTGAGIAAILAVTVYTFSGVGPSQSVSALQLAQNSSQALANMSPQESEYKKFYPHFVEWMQKAQQASDLRVLTYQEVVKAYPAEMGAQPATSNEPLRVIDDPSDGSSPDIRTLKYLEFTIHYDDNSTHKVIVGINSKNIPEAAFSHFISGPIEPRIGG